MKKFIKMSQTDKLQPSLFFENWSEGHEIKDQKGRSKVLYHGTTHNNFDTFKPQTDIDVDNYFGSGFYFSDSPSDVSENYATTTRGDLQNKVTQHTENLYNQLDLMSPSELYEQFFHDANHIDIEVCCLDKNQQYTKADNLFIGFIK